MSNEIFNKYRIMWIFTFFDLPVLTKTERKIAHDFRINLLKEGFVMMQFSVYIRHCASKEKAETHVRNIKRIIPSNGKISILTVTDKQFGDIINIWGPVKKKPPKSPTQLTLF